MTQGGAPINTGKMLQAFHSKIHLRFYLNKEKKMNRKLFYTTSALLICAALLLSACAPVATPAPMPTPAPVATTAPVAPAVPPTAVPTQAAAAPCLIVGALYGGPITDAGYNQAMHEAVA